MIGIRYEEVSVFPPPMDLGIGAKNQPALSIINGILLAPQTFKSPAVQEIVKDTALKNWGKQESATN